MNDPDNQTRSKAGSLSLSALKSNECCRCVSVTRRVFVLLSVVTIYIFFGSLVLLLQLLLLFLAVGDNGNTANAILCY